MPTSDVLFKMSLYVALVLILPGPTNTLLFSSGLKAGFRGTWHLVIAEALGYVVAISLWGLFLCSFVASRPWFYDVVKLVSAAFIFYLALKMWMKSPRLQDLAAAPVGFRDLFTVTLMNPKAFLFASAVFPLEAFRSLTYLSWTFATFLIVLVPIGVGWSCLGGVLTSRRSWATHTPTLLRCASLLLVMFSGTIAFSVLNK